MGEDFHYIASQITNNEARADIDSRSNKGEFSKEAADYFNGNPDRKRDEVEGRHKRNVARDVKAFNSRSKKKKESKLGGQETTPNSDLFRRTLG